jgi:hypothetical protein
MSCLFAGINNTVHLFTDYLVVVLKMLAALAAALAALVCGGHLGYTNQAWQDMINNPEGFLVNFTEYYQGLAGLQNKK